MSRQEAEAVDRARVRAVGSQSWAQHWQQVITVKVIGVILADVAAFLFVRDIYTRQLFLFLTAGVYLPLSLGLYLIQRRRPTPPNAVWLAITLSDISVIGAAQALFPGLSVAFLGLTPIVIVSAVLLGVRWTMVVAAFCWASLLAAAIFGKPGQPNEFSAVIGGLLLVGMAFLIGSLSEDERRAAGRSRRLAQAIASAGSAMDLTASIDGLCEAAREALGAAFCIVLLKEEDRLSLGGGSGLPAAQARDADDSSGALRDPASWTLPTVRAIRELEPIAVRDVLQDEPKAVLRPVMEEFGLRALASVPVHRHGAAMGVMNVYLRRPHRFTAEEIEYLMALAEHAGIAIERSRLFAKEREAVERLLELDRMKSEFVATVSHELRTPLTAIEGFALTLRDHWPEFSATLRQEFLERLRDNALSLDHLITHLLDFGRLERGEFQIQVREHDVGELVQRVLGNMVHELTEHPIVADVEPGLRVMTDRYAFDRILGNLLSNAAKFSPAGSTIEVMAFRHGPSVVLSVRDQGEGIAAQDAPRIFDRFYRGTETARGTGIGLAVVKDLVGLHGGTVEVANALPGAVFTVHLRGAAASAPAFAAPAKASEG